MKIRTLIVEDEVNARKALTNMLSFYSNDIEIIGQAASVKEALNLMKETPPDLLFLDVHLPDGTGFDLLKKIKKRDFKLVFITAYNEYALKAIKLSTLDYLLKPVNPNELTLAIEKVKEAIDKEDQINLQLNTCIENLQTPSQDKKIILNTSESVFVVEVNKLVRCEASENYTNIIIEGKDKILVAKTLKEFEEMLTGFGFFRTHQSHLINLAYVEAYEKKGIGKILLKTGEHIPVSTRRKEGFFKALEAIIS